MMPVYYTYTSISWKETSGQLRLSATVEVVKGGCCELEETALQSTGSDPEEPTKDEIDRCQCCQKSTSLRHLKDVLH